MGFLDFLRGGVEAGAAARTGFLTGEQKENDENKKDAIMASTLARQSRLDALKQSLDQAQIERDNAQAGYYKKRATTDATVPPHTLTTDEGIMQWDPVSKGWKRTGFSPPERASERAAGRMASREARLGTQQSLQGVERQISDTRADLRAAPTDPSTSDEEMPSRLASLRQRLDSLSHVSDSLNLEMKHPGGSAAAAAPKKTSAVALTPATSAAPSAADSDYARAADAYQQALKEGTDPATARSLYDRAVARLAKKHGQLK